MPEIDVHAIVTWDVLWVVLLAGGIGAVGGATRLLKNGYVTAPSHGMQWGTALLTGAVAAIAAFYVLAPTTPLKFVAAALISGYSGPALLDALDNKFRLLVAENKVAAATDLGKRALDVAEQATGGARTNLAEDEVDPLRAKIAALRTELAKLSA